MLEGCTSFVLDWLIEGPRGYLETNPSTSPEHSFIAPDGKIASVSYSSTMDMAIIREVFYAIISASEVMPCSVHQPFYNLYICILSKIIGNLSSRSNYSSIPGFEQK